MELLYIVSSPTRTYVVTLHPEKFLLHFQNRNRNQIHPHFVDYKK